MPGSIKDGGDDEAYCLFWLFLRQSGATVVLRTERGSITTITITMVAITIIGARDGGTGIAGGGDARRIKHLRLWAFFFLH